MVDRLCKLAGKVRIAMPAARSLGAAGNHRSPACDAWLGSLWLLNDPAVCAGPAAQDQQTSGAASGRLGLGSPRALSKIRTKPPGKASR